MLMGGGRQHSTYLEVKQNKTGCKKFQTKNGETQNLRFSIKLQLLHTMLLMAFIRTGYIFLKQALKFFLRVSLILYVVLLHRFTK